MSAGKLLFEHIFSKEVSNSNWTLTNFHELRQLVTPGNVNSLALLDLNSVTDVTWNFSGNNQTIFQMSHNE